MKDGDDERRAEAGRDRANVASPSLLYRDEKRFYDNLLVSTHS